MRFLAAICFLIGVVAVAIGVLWMGQGTGLILWPSESFMLNQRTWAFHGVLLTASGLLLLWLSRRGRRLG
ncbi:hypothetical protein [Novosphingobium colocasiae]|uniref:hypothetical protein n=1 Tax=Novosphingobium colocasiae TaxID=1256513 RepID=UPI0035ADDADF